MTTKGITIHMRPNKILAAKRDLLVAAASHFAHGGISTAVFLEIADEYAHAWAQAKLFPAKTRPADQDDDEETGT